MKTPKLLDGLMKVVMYVRDLEAQTRFYTDTLGLSIKATQEIHDLSKVDTVVLETGVCSLILYKSDVEHDDKNATKIVFRVIDVQSVRDALVKRGVAMSEILVAEPGVSFSNGHDPEGNRFSIESHAGE